MLATAALKLSWQPTPPPSDHITIILDEPTRPMDTQKRSIITHRHINRNTELQKL